MAIDLDEARIERNETSLWLGWTVATAGGMLLGFLPTVLLVNVLNLALAQIIVPANTGTIIGFSQWLVAGAITALPLPLPYLDRAQARGCLTIHSKIVVWDRITPGQHAPNPPGSYEIPRPTFYHPFTNLLPTFYRPFTILRGRATVLTGKPAV